MKLQTKAFMGLLVVCLMGVSSASSQTTGIFNDEIFTSPVLIEMELKQIKQKLEKYDIHECFVMSAYAHDNLWYQEIHELTKGATNTPIISKISWDGIIYKSLVISLENNFLPTFNSSEKIRHSIREVNPLKHVYGPLGDITTITDPLYDNKNNSIIYNINDGKRYEIGGYDVQLKKDMDTGYTKNVSFSKNDRVVSRFEYFNYSLNYKDYLFPTKIVYTSYNNLDETYVVEYTIHKITEIGYSEFETYKVEVDKSANVAKVTNKHIEINSNKGE